MGITKMNLIKFLFIGAIIAIVLGELGKFPFGGTSSGISVMDVFLVLTVTFFLVWKIGIKKKINLPKPFLILTGFWLIALVSLITSLNLSGGLYLVRFILYSCSFLTAYTLVQEDIFEFESLKKLFLKIGLAISLIGMFQLVFYPDMKYLTDYGFDPHMNRLVSTFLDPNFLGCFINIVILILITLYKKISFKEFIIAFLILISGVLLTFSRSAYLQLILGLGIYATLFNKKILLLLIVIPLVLYFAIPRFAERINGGFRIDTTASERVQSWQKGLQVFAQYPILGIGFNNLRFFSVDKNLVKTFSPDGGHSGAGVDSSLLVVASTTGVIGLVGYLIFWVYLTYSFLQRYVKTKKFEFIMPLIIMAELIINSQFINSLFFPSIMLLFYSILGAYYGYMEKD